MKYTTCKYFERASRVPVPRCHHPSNTYDKWFGTAFRIRPDHMNCEKCELYKKKGEEDNDRL
jgi:hypothetical protein